MTFSIFVHGLCSLAVMWGTRTESLHFVGTAMPDTVLAGPGNVAPSGVSGHWGRGGQREVYGQRVRIELVGNGPPELLEALQGDRKDVVLVPWDYDPSCEPTYWSRSARWVEPGLEAYYTPHLRPRSQWIDERPTLDVYFADMSAFPHGIFHQRGYGRRLSSRNAQLLDAREWFALNTILPTAQELATKSAEALTRVRAWESQHPDLAKRYPANEALASVRRRFSQ